MKRLLIVAAIAIAVTPLFAQSRIASDFEIATAKKEIASSHGPKALIAAHLNLGDLYLSRREGTKARDEYRDALAIAQKERIASRTRSDLDGYAVATSYAGLANAKLGKNDAAFESFEEAVRYVSDSPATWNLYSSAMRIIRDNDKAIAAARNAVAIEGSSTNADSGVAALLDLQVYRYALASALLDKDGCAKCRAEAFMLLEQVIGALESARFDDVRRVIAREEQFEIFSTTRGDPASYLSLLNRSRLQLARMLESDGRIDEARSQYMKMLELRSDDATALAALARLAKSDSERQQYFAASFEANPLSLPLIADYETYARANSSLKTTGDSAGAIVRRAIEEFARARFRESDAALDRLDPSLRNNDVVRYLHARNAAGRGDRAAAEAIVATMSGSPDLQRSVRQAMLDADAAPRPAFLASAGPLVRDPSASDLSSIAALLRTNTLAPDERARLDTLAFSSRVAVAGATTNGETTTIGGGEIGQMPFRFSVPTVFRGDFSNAPALRLEYRILGITDSESGEALLLEPVRLEVAQ